MNNGIERAKSVMFKRVAGGWVYRAPNPWVFGDAPHYLVNDAQKAQIEALMTSFRLPAYLRFAGGAAWVVAVLGGFRHLYGDDQPSSAVVVPMVFLFAISIIAVEIWLRRRRLEPILSGLPLTKERITFAEMRARRAAQPELREYMRARLQPLLDLPSMQDWITHEKPAQDEEGMARLLQRELQRRGHFIGPIDVA